MECFSTAGLPARRKLAFWNEVSSDTFTALEVEARDPQAFEGRLFRQNLGPLGLADVVTSPGCLRHTPAHVARAQGDRYTLLVALEGGFELRWNRRAREYVGAGSICLLDHAHPYELHFDGRSRTFCYSAGERFLDDVLPHPERLAGRVVVPRAAGARLFVGFTQSLGAELWQDAPALLTPLLADGLRGLMAAAYDGIDAPTLAGSREARRRQVLAFLEANLDDPELRPARVATHFGIPERTLRWLFAGEGEGLMAFVQRRRLERCGAQLADARWQDVNITDIALRNGFNNPTHFGAAFKRRYGRTPGEYRRANASR